MPVSHQEQFLKSLVDAVEKQARTCVRSGGPWSEEDVQRETKRRLELLAEKLTNDIGKDISVRSR